MRCYANNKITLSAVIQHRVKKHSRYSRNTKCQKQQLLQQLYSPGRAMATISSQYKIDLRFVRDFCSVNTLQCKSVDHILQSWNRCNSRNNINKMRAIGYTSRFTNSFHCYFYTLWTRRALSLPDKDLWWIHKSK